MCTFLQHRLPCTSAYTFALIEYFCVRVFVHCDSHITIMWCLVNHLNVERLLMCITFLFLRLHLNFSLAFETIFLSHHLIFTKWHKVVVNRRHTHILTIDGNTCFRCSSTIDVHKPSTTYIEQHFISGTLTQSYRVFILHTSEKCVTDCYRLGRCRCKYPDLISMGLCCQESTGDTTIETESIDLRCKHLD